MKTLTHPIRTIATLALAASAALLLNACLITSVEPFYFEWDVVEVPHLLGTWSVSDDEHWILEHDADGYLWRIVEDDEETVFEATFFEFQGSLFFDFMLHEDAYDGDDDLLTYAVRTHSVARARLEGDRLCVEHLSYEDLDEALPPDGGDLDLAHFRDSDDRVLLTGSTSELQGFLAWCMSREDCIGTAPDEVTSMTRVD